MPLFEENYVSLPSCLHILVSFPLNSDHTLALNFLSLLEFNSQQFEFTESRFGLFSSLRQQKLTLNVRRLVLRRFMVCPPLMLLTVDT